MKLRHFTGLGLLTLSISVCLASSQTQSSSSVDLDLSNVSLRSPNEQDPSVDTNDLELHATTPALKSDADVRPEDVFPLPDFVTEVSESEFDDSLKRKESVSVEVSKPQNSHNSSSFMLEELGYDAPMYNDSNALLSEIYSLTDSKCRSLQAVRLNAVGISSRIHVVSSLTTTESFKKANSEDFLTLIQKKTKGSAYSSVYEVYASHQGTRSRAKPGVWLAVLALDKKSGKTVLYFKHPMFPSEISRVVLSSKRTADRLFTSFYGIEVKAPYNKMTRDLTPVGFGLKCRRLLGRLLPWSLNDVCEINDHTGKKVSKVRQGKIRSLLSTASLGITSFQNFYKFFHYDSYASQDVALLPCYVQSLLYIIVKNGIF